MPLEHRPCQQVPRSIPGIDLRASRTAASYRPARVAYMQITSSPKTLSRRSPAPGSWPSGARRRVWGMSRLYSVPSSWSGPAMFRTGASNTSPFSCAPCVHWEVEKPEKTSQHGEDRVPGSPTKVLILRNRCR